MRYDDASQAGSNEHSETVARPDVDTLPAGSFGPATGNAVTGQGTSSGSSGADSVGAGPATVIAVQGAGGQTVAGNGSFQAPGQYGVLSMDAQGNFNYVRNPNTPDGVKDIFNYTLADAAGANASTTLTIDIAQVAAAAAGQGVVALPAGVELSDIHVNGRDLVINMPDGTQMVIPNGAVFVPEISIGDVQVPPTNIAALLVDSEPQPAAGPPPSSGGNWNDPVPPLDPGVPLGDLIPPTELGHTPPTFQEPAQGIDTEPSIIIETPDFPAGAVSASESVFEKGLATRNGGEPAGSGEIADGNASNNSDGSESNTGTIVFTAQDGLDSVTINGTAVTTVGQHIQGQFGTLTITGIDLDSGQITYSYTLGDNTSGDNTHDVFTIVVTDDDGDTATGSLTVNIIDDVPTALNDTDSVDLQTGTAAGNVMTGADTTSGAKGADTVGADNAHVTGVSSNGTGESDTSFDASGNLVVDGDFGTLTIKADGSYVYTAHEGAEGGGTDVFTYTITDGDGDTDTATLTITNADHTPTVTIETPGEEPSINASESVDEKGLPTRNGGEPEGTGEAQAAGPDGDTSESNAGIIHFDAQDGVGTIKINGTTVDLNPSTNQVISGAHGDLTITGVDLNAGTITYTYTLTDNTDANDPNGNADNFDVAITDTDGDTATAHLTVNIVDDQPIANDDTDSVTEDGSLVASGNVISGAGSDGDPAGGDFVGADNSVVTIVDGLNPGIGQVTADADGEQIIGQYGTLIIDSQGHYTYTLDNTNADVQALTDGQTLTESFQYTLHDGDGDDASAVLTITINGSDDVPTVDVPGQREPGTEVSEVGLPARGGEPEGTGEGANPAPNTDNSEITSGTITYTDGDGATTVTIEGTGGPITVAVGADIVGTFGTLHIDTFNPATHTITYTYTLADNVDHDSQTPSDSFQVVVSDSDGNPADDASATLTINIADDHPIAVADTDSVVEGHETSGNVLTGVGGDGNPAGADIPGADDLPASPVVGVAAGDTNTNVTNGTGVGGTGVPGTYGTLVLHADGTYTYTADPNTDPPAGATDTFTYTIIDNDGTASHTTLVIDVIDDATPSVTVPTEGGDGALVDEAGLPAHSGRPEGTGEAANPAPNTDNSEITSGQITYTPGDAPATVTIGGVTVAAGVDIVGTFGTLHIDSFDPVAHTINYTYTLTNNVDNDTQTAKDSFAVVVSDSDGNPADDAHATLTIDIVDDAPIARDDTDSVIEGASTAGNVLTGVGGDGNAAGADTPGADAYATNTVVGVAAGNTNANLDGGVGVGGTGVHGTYGTLILNANGTYTYNSDPNTNPPPGATDTFTYTIVDNDGSESNATLTISVIDDFQPQIGTPENLAVDEDGLATANLDNGDAGEVDHGGNDTDTGTVTVNYGSDRPGSTEAEWLDAIHFINPNTLDGDLTQNGLPIDFSIDGSGNLVGKIGATTIITISFTAAAAGSGGNVTYTYSVNLDGPVDQLPGDNTEGSVVLSGIQFQVTDADGDPASSSFSLTVYDDVPSLGTIDDGTANNDPTSGVTTGSLPYTPSADGTDSIVITPDLTDLKSDGHPLIGEMTDANTFTAYIDDDGTAGISGGDTVVFTIDVDPVSGTYTFDLQHPLDGDEQDVILGSSTSFGVGPSDSIIVSQPGLPNLVFVKGYHADSDFNFANWSTGGTVPSDQLVNGGVNGSTVGWGTDSNNFDATTFMRFDFGVLNDYDGAGPYTPPAGTMQEATKATFDLFNYDSNDHLYFLAHYNDGSTQLFTFTGTGQHTPAVITSPDGLTIAWIDVYTPDAGSGKVDLESITIITTTVDIDIPVSVTITDGDGDQVTGSFNINVADGNDPSSASLVQSSDSTLKTMSLETSSLSASNDNNGHQHEQRAFAVGQNTALMGALAAAGLEADHSQLGAHGLSGGAEHAPAVVPLQASAAMATALETTHDVAPEQAVHDAVVSKVADAPQSSSHLQEAAVLAQGNGHAGEHQGPMVTELLHGSAAPAHGPAAGGAGVTAATVAMPSAHQLAAAAGANEDKPADGAQHNEVVGKVLADSLHGGEGHGPSIDALLDGKAGETTGHDVIEALASHAAGAVPFGHTAAAAGFAGPHSMLSSAMMHHDAAPPAHG